jgi:uncharacterized protein (DUF1684 family)
MSTATQTTDPAAFTTAWETWHQDHEHRRTDPLGILAASSMIWLTDSPAPAPGAPGTWHLERTPDGDPDPVVELAPAESLTTPDGESLDGTAHLGGALHGGSVLLRFSDGAVRGAVEVGRRGDGVIVRPRRSDSSFLVDYPGTPAFPPNPDWAVPARLERFDHPRPTGVGSVVEGLEHVFDSPGTLVVELDGQAYRLTAFSGGADGSLTVLLRDATSGVSTYAASRTLSVPAPDAEGRTVIDFNRATNLPCAYTDFATCPLPPAENRLPVAIEAGEKIPLGRVDSDLG